jgi:hypothetical protein
VLNLQSIYLFSKKDPHKRFQRWKIRIWPYTVQIKYKEGIENIIADALSRIQGDNLFNYDVSEDYNEILVASIEITNENKDYIEELIESYKYDEKKPFETRRYDFSENECLNTIESLPTSSNEDEYDIYMQIQSKDEDIKWMVELIVKNKDEKPRIDEFNNPIRRILFIDYINLKVINGLLYREQEDDCGRTRLQLVLPEKN